MACERTDKASGLGSADLKKLNGYLIENLEAGKDL
jgi:hypothetical protein